METINVTNFKSLVLPPYLFSLFLLPEKVNRETSDVYITLLIDNSKVTSALIIVFLINVIEFFIIC
jgi:hypothetical protein